MVNNLEHPFEVEQVGVNRIMVYPNYYQMIEFLSLSVVYLQL